MTFPYYASAEQIMRDRSDPARGIARGRSVVTATLPTACCSSRRTRRTRSARSRRSTTASDSPRSAKYNEFEPACAAPVSSSPTCVDIATTALTSAAVPGQRLCNDAGHRVHRAAKAPRGGALRRRGRQTGPRHPVAALPHRIRRLGGRRDPVPGWAGTPTRSPRPSPNHSSRAWVGGGLRVAVDALSTPVSAPAGNGGDHTAAPRELTAADLEVAVLDRTRPRQAFRRLGHDEVSTLLDGGRSSKKVEPCSAGSWVSRPNSGSPAPSGDTAA